MSTSHDPEFYQSPKFSPDKAEAPPRQRGCFFYGCIIASVLALLMLISRGNPHLRRIPLVESCGRTVHCHCARPASNCRNVPLKTARRSKTG